MDQLPEFFGLDIGNHSIKVAQVKRTSETEATLLNIGGVPTQFGLLDNASDQGVKTIAEKIKAARDSAGIKTVNCVAGIPESPVFSRLLSIPLVENTQLDEAVHWELKPLIPVPISDVDIAFLEIGHKEVNGQKLVDVFAVAAPKTLTDRFKKLAEVAGLNLLALETEALANTRSVTFNYPVGEADLMIFDFGAFGTDIILSRGGVPVFTQNISTGSDALTRAIAADYGIDMEQAEQYKRNYGIDFTKGEGKIAKSIEPIMQILITEMKRTLTYFKEKLGESGTTMVFMCGEASMLPGLAEYVGKNLGLQTNIADPKTKLRLGGSASNSVKQVSTVGYSVAIGLGLKDK